MQLKLLHVLDHSGFHLRVEVQRIQRRQRHLEQLDSVPGVRGVGQRAKSSDSHQPPVVRVHPQRSVVTLSGTL